MKTNKYIIAIFMLIAFVACDDDFLEYDPLALDTTESYYMSFQNLDYTATSAYGMLCTRDVYDVIYTIGFQSACDDSEVGGENVNDWPEFQRIDRLTHTKNEGRIYRLWAYPYKGIRMTNTVIERAEDIRVIEMEKAKTDAEAAAMSELIDQRVAEMQFLRAFYHFTLVQVYGGVPIIDYLVDPDNVGMARNSIAEVLHFVQEELLSAIPVLKEKNELGSEIGRATKGAAQALLAKAYLYESSYAENYASDARFDGCTQKYDLALQYAENVIGLSDYYLVGSTGERFSSWRAPVGEQIGGFRWIFTLDGDNSGEGVWEIQNVLDGLGWVESRGTYLTIYTGIRFYNDPYDDDKVKDAGGWSFNLPTKYLQAAFGNSDIRETGLNSIAVDPKLDPRYQTTIGEPGDSVLINTGTDTWYPMNFGNLPTNTISRKYECSPSEYWLPMSGRHQEGPMNVRLIRFADVVLMAAEAALKTGDNTKALNYVNQVRTRARLSGDTGYPVDLTTVAFEDIVHERRLELAMESSRFFDLVRWNLAEKFISGTTLAAMGDGMEVNFVKGKHEFFPIPEQETQKATGLEQYDAWK